MPVMGGGGGAWLRIEAKRPPANTPLRIWINGQEIFSERLPPTEGESPAVYPLGHNNEAAGWQPYVVALPFEAVLAIRTGTSFRFRCNAPVKRVVLEYATPYQRLTSAGKDK